MNLINKETKKKVSWLGRRFHNLENRTCRNCKRYLEKHSNSIDIFFLLIYVFLQLILVISLFIFNKENAHFIVTIFVIMFLFVLSVERLVMRIKTGFEREAREIKTAEIMKWFYSLKRLLRKIERKELK